MPARNLLMLVLATAACVAAWYACERDRRGRRVDEVLSLIDATYIEPVDGDALVAAALDGAMSTLDENSAWLRGDGQRELEAALDQRFGGVGLELSIDDNSGGLTVAAPLPGGPAARAGVLAGDRVLAIDWETTAGMPLRDAVARLRGEPGSAVTLSVASEVGSATNSGAGTARDVQLVREVVQVESVEGDRRLPDGTWDWWVEGEPGVALVRITGFGERTATELESALGRVAAGQFRGSEPPVPLRGLVIDLRGNPGGLVTAAVDVCDLFLDAGVIVSTRGRRPARAGDVTALPDPRQATAGAVLVGVPIAVLVDGMTASAAEIVAACLQDHGRARVVGCRTYGKGTVQSIVPLAGGGLLKLTTAEYLRPAGAAIDRRRDAGPDKDWGVSPDEGFTIVPTSAALERLARWRRRRDSAAVVAGAPAAAPRAVDEVLARALDVFPLASAPATDLGGEKEASGDAHETVAAGA